MKINLIIIILFSAIKLVSAQENLEVPELIIQEIGYNSSGVYDSGELLIVIDKICSNTQLEKDVYYFDNEGVDLESLLGTYTINGEGIYKYYYCTPYTKQGSNGISEGTGLLVKNTNFFSSLERIDFKSNRKFVNENTFNCNIADIDKNHVVGIINLRNKIFVNEYFSDTNYVSILNENCELFERIKFSENSLKYFVSDEFILLKGSESILFITSGNR